MLKEDSNIYKAIKRQERERGEEDERERRQYQQSTRSLNLLSILPKNTFQSPLHPHYKLDT